MHCWFLLGKSSINGNCQQRHVLVFQTGPRSNSAYANSGLPYILFLLPFCRSRRLFSNLGNAANSAGVALLLSVTTRVHFGTQLHRFFFFSAVLCSDHAAASRFRYQHAAQLSRTDLDAESASGQPKHSLFKPAHVAARRLHRSAHRAHRGHRVQRELAAVQRAERAAHRSGRLQRSEALRSRRVLFSLSLSRAAVW